MNLLLRPSWQVRSRLVPAAALAAAVALCAPAANASGFGFARFAAEQDHPVSASPVATYYNPAALTLVPENAVLVDMSVAYRRVVYTRPRSNADAPDPETAPSANVGRARLSNLLFAPAGAAVFNVPSVLGLPRLKLGLSYFTPYGGAASWNTRAEFAGHPQYPGPVDGVARWHSIEGEFLNTYWTVAAAAPLGRRWSFGASLHLVESRLSDLRARADGTNDVTREGRVLVEARGYGAAFGVGGVWEALPGRLWLGASYQSRPNLGVGLRLNGRAEGNIGSSLAADVDVRFALPDVWRFGLKQRWAGAWEVRVFGDYTRFSAFERQCISLAAQPCQVGPDGSAVPGSAVLQNLPRAFRDTWAVRISSSAFPRAGLEVITGLGFESSAVPDLTLEPSLPDAFNASFVLGARKTLLKRITLGASYTHFVFVPRTARSALSSYATPSKQPDAGGHYALSLGVFNAHAEVRF